MNNQKDKKNEDPELDIFQIIDALFIKISSIEEQLKYIKLDIKFLKKLIITILSILSILLLKFLF
jgi:hypothetical protein